MSRHEDTLTKFGSFKLAADLTDYWRSKGYPGIIAHQYELPEAPGIWGVRSNMVGGLAPGGKTKAASVFLDGVA